MFEFNSQKTLEEIVLNEKATIILYYAKWCQPCKSISETLLNLKVNFGATIQVVFVDIDSFSLIALERNIREVPTLQYYKNGSLYLQEYGFRTESQLTRNIEALLNVKVIE